jgi:hypothetical protein
MQEQKQSSAPGLILMLIMMLILFMILFLKL